LVLTEYEQEGKRIHVFTTHAEYSQLGTAARAIFPLMQEVPDDHDIVIDFYTWSSDRPADPETTQQELHALLNRAGFPRPVRRILVAIAGSAGGHGMSANEHSLFAPRAAHWRKTESYAGCTP
jgi:hypothetical protein